MGSDIYVEPVPNLPEEPLLGGDVTEGVVRVGDTVRRPLNAQSAAIHAYLDHLAQAGFAEAPRFLGIDERGREVLTYIAGETGGRPLHHWARRNDLLIAVARLQRRLHDASVGFALPAGVAWLPPRQIDGIPPLFDTPELIGHNDMTPENLIFRDGVPIGIIDFDLAGPTTRLFDVIVTLRWWAPLCDPADRDPVMRDLDAGARMRTFIDAYGLADVDRQHLLDGAVLRCRRVWHTMRDRAQHEGGGWARMWDAGAGDIIRRTQDWLERERPSLAAAIAAKRPRPPRDRPRTSPSSTP
jgi:hypothetical protein